MDPLQSTLWRRRARSVFWDEYRTRPSCSVAATPPGGRLASALVEAMDRGRTTGGRRILEVGPGVGAVTDRIARRMLDDDHLDLVEVHPRFREFLAVRFACDPAWQRLERQSTMYDQPIFQHAPVEPYDVIILSIPFNVYSPEQLAVLLPHLASLASKSAQVALYGYLGARWRRRFALSLEPRHQVLGMKTELERFFHNNHVERRYVWRHLLPARVVHVALDAQSTPVCL